MYVRMHHEKKVAEKLGQMGVEHYLPVQEVVRQWSDRRKKLLPVSSLQAMYDEMKPLSVEQRMERFGLKPDRADVIIPAAEIFLTIAGIVHAADIHVPVIGLADGIVDSLYAKDLEREGKSKSAGTGSKLSQDSMSEA